MSRYVSSFYVSSIEVHALLYIPLLRMNMPPFWSMYLTLKTPTRCDCRTGHHALSSLDDHSMYSLMAGTEIDGQAFIPSLHELTIV
jgi:hypothetical protein